MVKRSPQEIARAFEIADQAMLDRLESECAVSEPAPSAFGLVGEDGREVKRLCDASPSIREAYEWLEPRGFVELLPEFGGSGEFIALRRQPEE